LVPLLKKLNTVLPKTKKKPNINKNKKNNQTNKQTKNKQNQNKTTGALTT
jgi:hypothetical protein